MTFNKFISIVKIEFITSVKILQKHYPTFVSPNKLIISSSGVTQYDPVTDTVEIGSMEINSLLKSLGCSKDKFNDVIRFAITHELAHCLQHQSGAIYRLNAPMIENTANLITLDILTRENLCSKELAANIWSIVRGGRKIYEGI